MRWHGPEWRSSLPRACSRSGARIAKSASCVARLCSISKLPRPTKNRRREVYKLLISADRKRVVSGKSVSVRVDLGGRRILKKKNQHHTPTPTHNTTHHH